MQWVLVAALAIAALAGCSVFQASLSVVNDSSFTVDEVRLSPSGASSAGDYRVYDTILPGRSQQLGNIWEGAYDLLAVDRSGGRWERSNFYMQPGRDYTWTLEDTTRIDPL